MIERLARNMENLATQHQSLDMPQTADDHYRTIFENAIEGIIRTDENGRILQTNPALAHLVGYSSPEELMDSLDNASQLLVDPNQGAELQEIVKTKGFVVNFTAQMRRKDGGLFWASVNVKVVVDPAGKIKWYQGFLIDISDRKHMQDRLAAAAAKNKRIAVILQQSMLLASSPASYSRIEAEALYRAALTEARVGGDFFDLFALNSESVALIIGDASGKGLAAAARTMEVKHALRAFLYEHRAPEVALAKLNQFLYETHQFDKGSDGWFIVVAVAVLNTTNGDTAFSVAGMDPPIILRTDGRVEQIEMTGMPLGIEPYSTYCIKTATLQSRDTLLMATDGLTEARRGSALLGNEGIARLAKRAGSNKPLQELGQAIYDGALDFQDGNLHDDVCLLLARRK